MSSSKGAVETLHSLDALRGFALIVGIFFHGTAVYVETFPLQLWPMREPSSDARGILFITSHMFRMWLFFLLAGLFGRMLLERKGTRGFVKDRAKRICCRSSSQPGQKCSAWRGTNSRSPTA